MSDLNKVMLIGRLGQKPELKTLSSGDAVTRLSVATSYQTKKDGVREERTEWHSVSVFGKSAENCVKFLDKGKLVYVEGHLHNAHWKAKDGSERNDREIRAETVTFLSRSENARAA
jgi:single-strand DNA-binding protein